ncbi:MAG: S-layer homology domain-containing protein [Firmicutes bacterium]|nr:S-layer homology domain-containing protein [Bacillota bacterium]
MRIKKSLISLLTAIIMVCALPISAAAAEPDIVYKETGDKNANTIIINNLKNRSVYSLQVELFFAEVYNNASFVFDNNSNNQNDKLASAIRTEDIDGKTKITLYLASALSAGPLNTSHKNSEVTMGVLNLGAEFKTPERVNISALNQDGKTAEPDTTGTSGGNNGGGGGGTSSSTSYSININTSANGSVSAEPSKAKSGTVITLTVKPNSGYELNTIEAKSKSGSKLSLTKKDDNKYTFKMPSSNVDVTAVFKESGIVPKPPVTEPTPMSFTDVNPSDWYYEAVRYVYDKGMMNGTSASAFSPNSTTTRGMIVTILHRLEGTPASAAAAFPDVAAGQYYTDAVAWASANGIVTGYGSGRFGPNDSITREQMSAILYRYARYKSYNTSASGDLSAFSDQVSISDYAAEPMRWAVGSGLITGMGDGRVAPLGNGTRAQIAAILMRFCENIAK